MNDIDDLVSSLLGIGTPRNEGRPVVSVAEYTIQQEPVHQEEETTEEVQVPETPQVTLDDSEYDDILSSIGYDDSNGEEMEDENIEGLEEEVVTNDGLLHQIGMSPAPTAANLDEEEDAEWEERIDSGEITEVQPNATQRKQIPENSPTLTMDDSTSRFSGTMWYAKIKQQRIILAGLGGIGSWCALQLARMTPETLFLYDDDIVESANMSGQLYSSEDVGQYKSDAINRMISRYSSIGNSYSIRDRFTNASEPGPIMICGFDNMKARSTFFNAWKGYVDSLSDDRKRECLFIDGRLSIDTLQVFCITGDDSFNMERYRREFLFSDSEAEETVCSMKQTTYLACMIGSVMVNLFTNFTANLLDPIIPYDVPFFTEYDAQNMIFKTER